MRTLGMLAKKSTKITYEYARNFAVVKCASYANACMEVIHMHKLFPT